MEYDALLGLLYGKYMILPPIEESANNMRFWLTPRDHMSFMMAIVMVWILIFIPEQSAEI